MLQVAEPFRGDERDDADDGVAYGEDTPQHADRLGIADVVGSVHVRGLDVLDLRTHLRTIAVDLPSMQTRCSHRHVV